MTFRYFITSTFGCLFYDFSLFNQTTKSVVPICHRRALSLSAAAAAKAASECDWALALLFASFYITYCCVPLLHSFVALMMVVFAHFPFSFSLHFFSTSFKSSADSLYPLFFFFFFFFSCSWHGNLPSIRHHQQQNQRRQHQQQQQRVPRSKFVCVLVLFFIWYFSDSLRTLPLLLLLLFQSSLVYCSSRL